jgi:L-ascorbate metabolism protein UlaG (beta-lactamase superfamily)
MKYLLTLIFSILTLLPVTAQEVFKTSDGEVTLHPILHASMVWEWQGNTIYFDPYGGAELFAAYDAPDIVLITHLHGDHYNPGTLKGLDLGSATLVAPRSVVDELDDAIEFKAVKVLPNGQAYNWQGMDIESVPMYNLPDDETSRHPKGWGNGYVVTIGGKRFYVSGDTEDVPEMRNLQNIDVAFVCMNLPYTMNINQAASAVLAFQPDIIIPFHYRGKSGFSNVSAFKEMVNRDNKTIDVRLLSWYPN